MINFEFVVYSHSDYSDVLKIQTDYLSGIENKTLLIDNHFDDPKILSQYREIIRYDDKFPYSNRILNLKNLKYKYILFIHDIDILINYSDDFLKHCILSMEKNNLDRIDLQYYSKQWNPNSNVIKFSEYDDNILMVKQENLEGFIYNVNPSIWKLDSFMNIMSKFIGRNYRDIEHGDIQSYSSNFNIYKFGGDEYIQVGFFKCIKEFIFLHITHGGSFLPKKDNNLPQNIQKKYEHIIKKYLDNSNKPFRTNMHG
jgi:hypothetical protein